MKKLSTSCTGTQRARKFKEVQAKNSWNQIDQKNFFSWNCIFGIPQFKNWFLAIFEIAKNGISDLVKKFIREIHIIFKAGINKTFHLRNLFCPKSNTGAPYFIQFEHESNANMLQLPKDNSNNFYILWILLLDIHLFKNYSETSHHRQYK